MALIGQGRRLMVICLIRTSGSSYVLLRCAYAGHSICIAQSMQSILYTSCGCASRRKQSCNGRLFSCLAPPYGIASQRARGTCMFGESDQLSGSIRMLVVKKEMRMSSSLCKPPMDANHGIDSGLQDKWNSSSSPQTSPTAAVHSSDLGKVHRDRPSWPFLEQQL